MTARNTTFHGFSEPRLPLNRVFVELTNRCNFACHFCPNPVMERAKGEMELALLDAIIEEIAAVGLARLVLFHQQGEPTLHRHLNHAVAKASALGLATSVTTNGSTLTDPLIDGLLQAGLSQLIISLQTPDPASFSIRGARNLAYPAFEERVVRGVRRVLAADSRTEITVSFLTKPLFGASAPTVGRGWPLVSSKAALHQLLETWAARFLDGAGNGATPDALRRAVARTGMLSRNELRLGPRLVFEARPVGEWATPTYPPGRRWYPAPFGSCHGLTDHLAILWNGQYAYCCVDHDGHTSQARFQDTSLLDFLGSEPVQAALRGFRRLRPVHPYCRQCLGGPGRLFALVKGLGAALYFGVLRRTLRRTEIE
ncbi:MAG TPA: radical SAM/SPASM domain-containing protein [Vicinamibacteria bacterium]|nr:radical SAM/SPASM domain-containing protein [Vicinamibacteria bacterium]